MWENWSQAKEMYEIGLLCIDQQENAIEGCVRKDRVAVLKGKLKEGTVYKIEQFMLTGQKIKNRVAGHLYRIKLAKYSKIAEIVSQPEDFPFIHIVSNHLTKWKAASAT